MSNSFFKVQINRNKFKLDKTSIWGMGPKVLFFELFFFCIYAVSIVAILNKCGVSSLLMIYKYMCFYICFLTQSQSSQADTCLYKGN